MSFETLGFLEQFTGEDPGPLARAIAAARVPDPEAVAEAKEAEARTAAAAQRAEDLALQNRALGDPLGEISRAQAIAAAARDRIATLEAELAKERKTLARAQGNVEFFASRMQAAHDSAQRSAGADLLAPAKAALEGHRQYVAASRAARSAVQAGTPRQARLPFSAGGEARRSEVTCGGCKAEGIDADTSFLIHSDPDRHPGLDAEIDFDPEGGRPAQRRGASYVREISR